MRIAIVHPWFLAKGGAEQVVEVLAELYPSADIFTLFFNEKDLPDNLRGRNIHALALNWLPAKYKLYRSMLPFYPLMFESLDLRDYDVVISSDSCVTKGILINQNAIHVCYCHSPMRCLWDLHREFREELPAIARPIFTLATHYVRQWDFSAAKRVDDFVANSQNVAQRISKFYGRESTVIYPPVNTLKGFISPTTDDYYLSVGRLTNVKKIDLLIKACNQLKRRLIVAGAGREAANLKAIAGPTVEFAGRVSETGLQNLYANCRALLFAADEDFGIVPVEAQSYGRPVIAYGRGGALETIIPLGNSEGKQPTGVLFPEQTESSVKEAILAFEHNESRFIPAVACRNARAFDTSVFARNILDLVESATANWSDSQASVPGKSALFPPAEVDKNVLADRQVAG